MGSTVLASRNETSWGHQSFMGKIPNYSNNNPHHLNPNPNSKPKLNKKRHLPNAPVVNGRHHNLPSRPIDSSAIVVSQAASDDAYSFNQRPMEANGGGGYGDGFNHGGYVNYNVAARSRRERNELRKKLIADLEKIRNLSDRIEAGQLNAMSSHGNFKKFSGNKRQSSLPEFGSSIKEPKRFHQALEKGKGGSEAKENLLKACRQVLTKLMKHKHSWVFNKPVDAVALGLHDYHQIIKRPMDLGTVKSNLSKNLYATPSDFAADVRLVFENAMLYNPKTDEVHGMAYHLLTQFEELFGPIKEKLASHHQQNEFSAVNELQDSSWDDIRTPERPQKMVCSSPVAPPVSSKQNHSSASNPSNPPSAQSPVPTPSPMPAQPIKPSGTRGTVGKQPKPRAKDPHKREMSMEEKQRLGLGLQSLPQEKMPQLVQIINKRNDHMAQEGDELEIDIEALDIETLWELDRFVTNWKKFVSKTKRQALLVNCSSAAAATTTTPVDIDDVPLIEKFEGMKKNKKEAGEEDVDIGDEMPESSFPPLEIEKDDCGGQGHGTGNDNGNASSSSSSSSGSSSDSSSSSDSESGSSSGSDSDADEAQS